MKLAHANILLEIFLKQKKSEICKNFLSKNTTGLFISDFSRHSIGIVLLKSKAMDVFRKFLADTLPSIQILSLPANTHESLFKAAREFALDLDDAYQHVLAKNFNLKIAMMDQDFRRVDDVDIIFP